MKTLQETVYNTTLQSTVRDMDGSQLLATISKAMEQMQKDSQPVLPTEDQQADAYADLEKAYNKLADRMVCSEAYIDYLTGCISCTSITVDTQEEYEARQ